MASAAGDTSTTITLEQASDLLNRLAQQVNDRGKEQPVAVTRDGIRVYALVPWELYESLVEMVDVLGDHDTVESLRAGIAEVERGDFEDLDDVRAELGM